MPKLCKIHGKPPILIYPCCVGAKGGQATGGTKGASSRANLEKARSARQRGVEPPAIGGPDPAPDRPP